MIPPTRVTIHNSAGEEPYIVHVDDRCPRIYRADGEQRGEALHLISNSVLEIIYGFLQDSEPIAMAPASSSHMARRVTQICRQDLIGPEWVTLTRSNLTAWASNIRSTRGAPSRLRIELDENDSAALPNIMRLVNRHFYHLEQLHIRLPGALLFRAFSYLGADDGPMLKRFVVQATAPNSPSVMPKWKASHNLIHWNGHLFDNLRHVVFTVFAPCVSDTVWSFMDSLELVSLDPPRPLEDYLEIMDRSPFLGALKIVGSMRPGNLLRPPLPTPAFYFSRLKTLYLSNCSSHEVNIFIGQVDLPALEDLCIAPSESPQDETFNRMLRVDRDGPHTISAFSNVRLLEIGVKTPRDKRVASLSCQLFRDEGAFTISLPVDHRGIFANVVGLFPRLECFTIGHMPYALDWPSFGRSETVRTLRMYERNILPSQLQVMRLFPKCNLVLKCVPIGQS